MFSRQYQKTQPLFIIADILLIWLAFDVAYATRSHLVLARPFALSASTRTLLTLSALITWVLVGLWMNVYDAILRTNRLKLVATALQQSLWATGAVVVFQYIQRLEEYSLSRPFVVLLFLYGATFSVAFRLAARAASGVLLRQDLSQRRLYIVGTGETALRVARLIEQNKSSGLSLEGFLDDRPGSVQLGRAYEVLELARLPNILQTRVVDEIVFAVDAARLVQLEETLLLCKDEGVQTRIHLGLFRHLRSRVHLESLGDEQLLTFSGAPHDEVALVIKRIVDCMVALCALAVLWPVLLLIAVLIRISSPGPAIFRQERCGLNGRRFVLLKFRTMFVDAERRKADLEASQREADRFQDSERSPAHPCRQMVAAVLARRAAAVVEHRAG